MQSTPAPLPVGTIIQGRYLVQALLSKSGAGAVYLVSDQLVKRNTSSLFVLQEKAHFSEQARYQFVSEEKSLRKLHHPALPRVYRIFGDDKLNRVYMLTDYIEGPNLELLRLNQPRHSFSFTQVMSIIAPVIDALTYLHCQHPPVIHQNIRPTNIILSQTNGKTFLVNFGLYKQYPSDSSTGAVRPYSLSYVAPEQYRGEICTQSDIYALGATFYTLLTGLVPPAALYRIKQLGDTGVDPLIPVNRVIPAIPTAIIRAIQCALSISSRDRFSTVQQFWEALWQVSNAIAEMQAFPSSMLMAPNGENEDLTEKLPAVRHKGIKQQTSELSIETERSPLRDSSSALPSTAEAAVSADPLGPLPVSQEEEAPVPASLQERPHKYRGADGRKGGDAKRSVRTMRKQMFIFSMLVVIVVVISTSLWLYTADQHHSVSALPSATSQFNPTSTLPQATASPNVKGITTPVPASTPSLNGVVPVPGSVLYTVQSGDSCDSILRVQMHMADAGRIFIDSAPRTIRALSAALGQNCSPLLPGGVLRLPPQYPLIAVGGVVLKIEVMPSEQMRSSSSSASAQQQPNAPRCAGGCLLTLQIAQHGQIHLLVHTGLSLRVGSWVWAQAMLAQKAISGFDHYPYVDSAASLERMVLQACAFQVDNTLDHNALPCDQLRPNSIKDDGGVWLFGVIGANSLDPWHYQVHLPVGTRVLLWLSAKDGSLQFQPGNPVYRYDETSHGYVPV